MKLKFDNFELGFWKLDFEIQMGYCPNGHHLTRPRNKISVFKDISVLGLYGNIGNIGKYRWIF